MKPEPKTDSGMRMVVEVTRMDADSPYFTELDCGHAEFKSYRKKVGSKTSCEYCGLGYTKWDGKLGRYVRSDE